MKKFLFILTVISLSATAQVNPHAIGARLHGDGRGNGAELSYQHGLGDANRLEIDLGGRSHKHWKHVGLYVGYHWVFNLTDGLNWYIGPGAAIGNYRSNHFDHYGTTLAVGGQIGLEYDFTPSGTPLQISLDARPLWEIWEYDEYYAFGYAAALSVRYTF